MKKYSLANRQRDIKTCLALFLAWIILGGQSAFAQADLPKAEFLGKFGIWSNFKYQMNVGEVCFTASKPYKLSFPTTRNMVLRAYVSHWKKADAQNSWETSLLLRGLKNDGKINVKIENNNFSLKTAGDRAFLQQKEKEIRLVHAMKRGNRMLVTATDHANNVYTQKYSLTGIQKALSKLAEECGLAPPVSVSLNGNDGKNENGLSPQNSMDGSNTIRPGIFDNKIPLPVKKPTPPKRTQIKLKVFQSAFGDGIEY